MIENANGKAGMWTAVFGSTSLRQSRTYTYAVAEQVPDIAKGVKAQSPVPWSGPTTAVMTFPTSDFTIDSDAAYKTAAEKAADWLKSPENAAKPVAFSLGAAQRFPAPVLYILFGDDKLGFVVPDRTVDDFRTVVEARYDERQIEERPLSRQERAQAALLTPWAVARQATDRVRRTVARPAADDSTGRNRSPSP